MPVAVRCLPLNRLPDASARSIGYAVITGRERRLADDLMHVPVEYRTQYAVSDVGGFSSRGEGDEGVRFALPAADADRWEEAARRLRARVQAIAREADESDDALRAPWGPVWRRLWWMFRYRLPGRRELLHARYEATWGRLHVDLIEAFREHAEQTRGLEALVSAAIEQRDRAALLDRVKKRLVERGEFLRRSEALATALADPEARVWSCAVRPSYADNVYFEIWLTELEEYPPESPLLSGATAREVQAALDNERAANPRVRVSWEGDTGQAVEERYDDHDSDVRTWEELTGRRIETHPDLDGSSSHRGYGPSSTYGSDYGGFSVHI